MAADAAGIVNLTGAGVVNLTGDSQTDSTKPQKVLLGAKLGRTVQGVT